MTNSNSACINRQTVGGIPCVKELVKKSHPWACDRHNDHAPVSDNLQKVEHPETRVNPEVLLNRSKFDEARIANHGKVTMILTTAVHRGQEVGFASLEQRREEKMIMWCVR